MPAMTRARMRWRWSGGKSRVSGPAADDADGPPELDPVRVNAGAGGGCADQGADRVVGKQVAPDLLPHHARRFGPEYFPRPSQVGLQLLVPGLVLPPLVVAPREDARGRIGELGDGGDQGDDLVFPVALAVGDLVLDHAHVPGFARVQVIPGAGALQDLVPCLAPDLRVYQHRPVGAVRAELQRRGEQGPLYPPQQPP